MNARLPLLLLVCTGFGCSELGNPTLRRGLTEAAEWNNGVDGTTTRALSVPASEASRLIGKAPRGGVDHLDTIHSPTDVATLVVVQPRWGRSYAPAELTLATVFEFEDGSALRRLWRVRSADAPWSGIFALRDRPRRAVTAMLF